jgi:hypothetical protein
MEEEAQQSAVIILIEGGDISHSPEEPTFGPPPSSLARYSSTMVARSGRSVARSVDPPSSRLLAILT